MFKDLLKYWINLLGYSVTKYNPFLSEFDKLQRMLSIKKVDLVLDVGANIGQYGFSLRRAGYSKRIISFEPQMLAWQKLNKNTSNDPLWEIAPRCALGDNDTEITINISNNSVSSSVLNMLESHSNAAPDSKYQDSEIVHQKKLDSIFSDLNLNSFFTFLKIDTQGYEFQILKGANKIINKVIGIQVEVSTIHLYQDQKLYDEIFIYLKDLGFTLWLIIPGFTDPNTGRMLQFDAVFFR